MKNNTSTHSVKISADSSSSSDSNLTSIKTYQDRIENYLDHFLSFKNFNTELLDAIRYSVLNGGKRIRPLLVYVIGEALGAKRNQLDAPAAAIELIHCYSLIHDDLPAMDNDDLRRGKPTCHKAFDEARAILAGDALQSLAFELLSDEQRNLSPAPQQIKMMNLLAKASGIMGMVGGQSLDIGYSNTKFNTNFDIKLKPKETIETKKINLPEHTQNMTIEMLTTMHQKKTGALIQAAVQLGALASGCENTKILALLQNYAENLGLAFQVQDDILDVEGTAAILGKNPGQDAALNKQTFTELLGLEAARMYMKKLYQNAMTNIEILAHEYGLANHQMRALTDFLLQRQT